MIGTILLFVFLSVRIYVEGYSSPIYAVNCGGFTFTDSYGHTYEEDTLANSNIGIASDHGSFIEFSRVSEEDSELYKTERYHTSSFSYSIPVHKNGLYSLLLKFSEVYFTASEQKVFDVHLNTLPIVTQLDIFDKVGHGVAHDEVIEFRVEDGQVTFGGLSAPISDGHLQLTFVKAIDILRGRLDNPKINAFALFEGPSDGVPKLPEYYAPADVHRFQREAYDGRTAEEDGGDVEDEVYTGDDAAEQEERISGPEDPVKKRSRIPDPYESNEYGWSVFVIVVSSLAAALPVIFCLCVL